MNVFGTSYLRQKQPTSCIRSKTGHEYVIVTNHLMEKGGKKLQNIPRQSHRQYRIIPQATKKKKNK